MLTTIPLKVTVSTNKSLRERVPMCAVLFCLEVYAAVYF